ncbi:hypothetical protein CALVIDRAFT_531744 [Calocera viscosa TUFC12733]|uniref:Uncharacterized protein n=1 Tax=Calocera viscosa (strain TUFC12733) TaxID=1330018 RepID=A0A167FYB4_CALVF|nr:hypothetical protein CALVIDRAFT_531744 [Calocera viscosa TUFC12733]
MQNTYGPPPTKYIPESQSSGKGKQAPAAAGSEETVWELPMIDILQHQQGNRLSLLSRMPTDAALTLAFYPKPIRTRQPDGSTEVSSPPILADIHATQTEQLDVLRSEVNRYKMVLGPQRRLATSSACVTPPASRGSSSTKPSAARRRSSSMRRSEAARTLAEGFAEEGECELREVVARRTIEGQGRLEKGEAPKWYPPENAWAWKALGRQSISSGSRSALPSRRSRTPYARTRRTRPLGSSLGMRPREAATLQIDNKTAHVEQLGFLYLFYQDVELANHAFLPAQTLDPDQPLAWVGPAMLSAVMETKPMQARCLSMRYSHPQSFIACQLLHSSKLVMGLALNWSRRETSSSPGSEQIASSSPSALWIIPTANGPPPRPSCTYMGSSVYNLARSTSPSSVQEAIALLEKEYETSEDKAIEGRYAVANEKPRSITVVEWQERGSVAVVQQRDQSPTPSYVTIHRAQAPPDTGMAHFLLNELETTRSTLETTPQQLPEAYPEVGGHITPTLVKVLWVLGTEEARETAKSLLLEWFVSHSMMLASVANDLSSTSANPHNLSAINNLASISKIDALPSAERLSIDPGGEVNFLLSIHHLSNGMFS